MCTIRVKSKLNKEEKTYVHRLDHGGEADLYHVGASWPEQTSLGTFRPCAHEVEESLGTCCERIFICFNKLTNLQAHTTYNCIHQFMNTSTATFKKPRHVILPFSQIAVRRKAQLSVARDPSSPMKTHLSKSLGEPAAQLSTSSPVPSEFKNTPVCVRALAPVAVNKNRLTHVHFRKN